MVVDSNGRGFGRWFTPYLELLYHNGDIIAFQFWGTYRYRLLPRSRFERYILFYIRLQLLPLARQLVTLQVVHRIKCYKTLV